MSDDITELYMEFGGIDNIHTIQNFFEESETEPDPPPVPPPEFCFPCYPRSHEWFIKIQNFAIARYNRTTGRFDQLENKISGEIKYLSSYHSKSFPTSICQIFDNLVLPYQTFVVSRVIGGNIVIEYVLELKESSDWNKIQKLASDYPNYDIYLTEWSVIDREHLYDIKILGEQNI